MATLNVSDVFELENFTNDLAKKHMDDLSDETLFMSTFGMIADTTAQMMQNAVVVSGELSNEAIPTRAKFDRNVITHALSVGINDINAKPSTMKVIIFFPEKILLENMKDDNIIIDKDIPIFYGDYEFHLDYDMRIYRTFLADGVHYVYSARYIMDKPNPISTIKNPYLPPISVFKLTDLTSFIGIMCTISQIEYREIQTKILTDNLIENKTFTFDFDGQLAAFDLTIVDPRDPDYPKYLTPVYDGLYDDSIDMYCYYSFVDSNTIRIKFNKDVYEPVANSQITIRLYTTHGSEGNFTYKDDVTVTINSTLRYPYNSLYMLLKQRGDNGAFFGEDRATVAQLQKKIPKEALARGSVTNATDLNNYFNQINTENSHLKVFRKRDNQLERLYYTYNIIKDTENNVVPTNTIDVKVPYSYFTNSGSAVDSLTILPGTKIYLERDSYGNYDSGHVDTGLPEFNPEFNQKFCIDPNDNCVYINGTYRPEVLLILPLDRIHRDDPTQTTGPRYISRFIVRVDDQDIDMYSKYNDKLYLTDELEGKIKRVGDIVDNEIRVSFVDLESEPIFRIMDFSNAFVYMTPFTMKVNQNPLFASYYIDILHDTNYLEFNWINDDCGIQFIASTMEVNRNFFTDRNTYHMTIDLAQNIMENYQLTIIDPDTKQIVQNKIKVIGLIYNDARYQIPYRYIEAELCEDDLSGDTGTLFRFKFDLNTNNVMTDENELLITNAHEPRSGAIVRSEFKHKMYMDIYILLKTDSTEGSPLNFDIIRNDLDGWMPKTKTIVYEDEIYTIDTNGNACNSNGGISPEATEYANNNPSMIVVDESKNYLDGYTISNIYRVTDGFNIFYNYTDTINSEIKTEGADQNAIYRIKKVPLIKYDYIDSEERMSFIIKEIRTKLEYINKCLDKLETSFGIDYKLFNTYGPATIFYIRDDVFINRVNLSMTFNLKLYTNSDKGLVKYIKKDIKDYMEQIDDVRDLHMPNLITYITNTYREQIVYFEFVDINGYGPGEQHVTMDETYETSSRTPEFLNINTIRDDNGDPTPDILIQLM